MFEVSLKKLRMTTSMLIIGEYKHSLDEKNRISLPAKFRKELGARVVLTNGLSGCLFVFSLKNWSKFSDDLSKLSMVEGDKRKFSRFMFGGASEQEVDSAGRILIPDFLKEFANLKSKAVVVGVHSRVEIWSEKAWLDYRASVQKDIDTLAEKLGEAGALV